MQPDNGPAGPPVGAAHDEPHAPLLLRRDQITLVVLGAVVLGWLVVDWLVMSRWGAESVEVVDGPGQDFALRLDPNEATWIELSQLPGIGETIAKRIVAERDVRPFRTLDELKERIRGIGPKVLERIRPHLHVATTRPTRTP